MDGNICWRYVKVHGFRQPFYIHLTSIALLGMMMSGLYRQYYVMGGVLHDAVINDVQVYVIWGVAIFGAVRKQLNRYSLLENITAYEKNYFFGATEKLKRVDVYIQPVYFKFQ